MAADVSGAAVVASVAAMRWRAVIVGVCAGLAAVAPVAASPPDETVPVDTTPVDTAPTDTAPVDSIPVDDTLPPAKGPLVVVPAGCALPQPAAVVFEGTATSRSLTAVRFRVERVLAGTVEGRERVSGIVDVQYGDDARFLAVGERYIVGAASDGDTGLLGSKVREASPLFGGDAVIGINDSDVQCPRLEDPVRTLLPDGTSVDSGVLTPLKGHGGRLLAALLVPFAVGFAVLVVLVVLKLLVFGVARSLRDLGDAPPPSRRDRRHRAGSSGGDEALA